MLFCKKLTQCTYLSLIADCRFVGELHLGRLENGVLFEYSGLALVVAERLLAVQALVEDHAHAPHVHLTTDLWWVFADDETLGRQVPDDKVNIHIKYHLSSSIARA